MTALLQQVTPDGYPYWQADDTQPAASLIGPQEQVPINLTPVEHAPEFETKLKLTPVDHEPDFGMTAKPVEFLPDFADVLDTGQNAPESRQTLEEQQRQLMGGRRPAQMFPAGTEELPLPPGMVRTENERGAFHHQPSIQAEEINTLSSQGRENELLNLGPFSKPEIEARAAQGEMPLVITEYTPEGVEVRSAAGTVGTVGLQQSYFEATMTPGNRIVVGPPPARTDWMRLLQTTGHVIFGAPMPARDGTPQAPSGGLAMGTLDWLKQPGKIVGTEFDTQPAVPGQWSDEDEARRQIHDRMRQEEMTSFGAGTAMNMMGVGTLAGSVQPGLTAGTFGGKLAKGADHAALERAIRLDTEVLGSPEKIMEIAQKSNMTIPQAIEATRGYIWNETGWFKGPDGHWRFEIPDNEARVDVNAGGDRMPLGKGVPQAEEFQHQQLYENYPRAARLPLRDDLQTLVPGVQARAAYLGTDEGITLNPSKLIKEDETRSSILHENQHHIQELEGFAEGSSPQIEQSIMAQQGLAADTGSKSPIVEQLRQAILRGEYGMPGEPIFTEAARRLLKLEEEFHADTAKENYRKSAGEVEARNVQARRDMTPEERRDTPPWLTEDVPQSEQIVRKYNRPAPKTDTDTKPAPTFYSAVAKRIDAIPTAKASPEQWAGVLKNSPGIKAEELKWLGVDDWLKEQKGPVSKKDLQDYVKANQIELKEVRKTGGQDVAGWDVERQPNGEWTVVDRAGEPVGGFHNTEGEARMALREWGAADPDSITDSAIREHFRMSTNEWETMSRAENQKLRDEYMDEIHGGAPTKFHGYQLPGGENYREMLLTLPRPMEKANDFIDGLRAKYGGGALNKLPLTAAERRRFDQLTERADDPTFQSSHWDEPNVLAHIRMSDRMIEGKKTLLVEEVQSDWHQKGKRDGYKKSSVTPERRAKLVAERDQLSDAVADLPRNREFAEHEAEWVRLMTRITEINDELGEGGKNRAVPDAPFKTTWPELAMKRVIREAAEKGYDKVAWTPGEAQAARYDLSKQLSKIEYDFHQGGKKLSVYGFDHSGGEVVTKHNIPVEKLPDVIGKDLAKKIVDGGEMQGDISGLDLKVGGEGMKGFYDQILPATVNKLAKRFGVKVEKSELRAPSLEEEGGRGERNYGVREVPETNQYRAHVGDDAVYFDTWGEAMKWVKEQRSTPVHVLDITPEMRKSVVGEGFPMFSMGDVPKVKPRRSSVGGAAAGAYSEGLEPYTQ